MSVKVSMDLSVKKNNPLTMATSGQRPNFLIVGAAKSGTSSLWHYLRQHPQVYMPVNKEPNFFAFAGQRPDYRGPAPDDVIYDQLYQYSVTESADYQALFAEADNAIAVGEASVRYLYFPEAAERIWHHLPSAKLVLMLRDPVERLYSHYCMNVGMYGLEPLSLAQALVQEPARKAAHWGWDWHYASVGRYYEQVKRYIDRFPREQLKIFLYEDFCQDTLSVVQQIYAYLGVDSDFCPNLSSRSKPAYIPKSRALYRFMNEPNRPRSWLEKLLPAQTFEALIDQLMQLNARPIPLLDEHLRIELQQIFRPDIEKLQDLINRDLSHWLAEP